MNPEGGRYVIPNGWLIQARRMAMGWGREELSWQAHVSVGTIANLENGKRAYPRTLGKVAKALGLTVDELIQQDSLDHFAPIDTAPTAYELAASIRALLDRLVQHKGGKATGSESFKGDSNTTSSPKRKCNSQKHSVRKKRCKRANQN